jgi:hypothetical protein
MTLQELLAFLWTVPGLVLGGAWGVRHGWLAGLLVALSGALLGLAAGYLQQECSSRLDTLARRVSAHSRAAGTLLHAADGVLTLSFAGVFLAVGLLGAGALLRLILRGS